MDDLKMVRDDILELFGKDSARVLQPDETIVGTDERVSGNDANIVVVVTDIPAGIQGVPGGQSLVGLLADHRVSHSGKYIICSPSGSERPKKVFILYLNPR